MAHLQYFNLGTFGEQMHAENNYSQAVKVDNRILISGQGGWGRDKYPPVMRSDLADEIDQTFDNVDYALKSAGGKGWSQVFRVKVYVVASWKEAKEPLMKNMKKWCPNHQPLLTVIGTPRLALDGMNIEIEVEAHVG